MELLNVFLSIFLLLLSAPIGFIIAWLARDELIIGRKWFIAIILTSILSTIIFLFFDMVASLSSFFIFIVSLISWIKSFDKRWTKKSITRT
ncbi:hypothetical protein FJZ18_01055 [Candidatus Pacearchaeota archaeon]|nr:hypothetical protein [Candidatus Pacearchaeota archaeon]